MLFFFRKIKDVKMMGQKKHKAKIYEKFYGEKYVPRGSFKQSQPKVLVEEN